MTVLDNLISPEKLGGDFLALKQSVIGGSDTVAFGLGFGAKVHTAAYLKNFVLYVAEDKLSAKQVCAALSDYLGDSVFMLPEKDDILIHRKAFLQENTRLRVETLAAIATGRAKVVVATAEAIVQYLPDKKRFANGILVLEKGQSIEIATLIELLISAGYTREDTVDDKCTFSLKGDILNVFPSTSEVPYRISFFGDEIESIKSFEPESMMSIAECRALEILPCSDIILPDDIADEIASKIKADEGALTSEAEARAEEISQDMLFRYSLNSCEPSLLWLMPYVKNYMCDITAYLPKDAVVIFDQTAFIVNKLKNYANEHKLRVKELSKSGEVLKSHLDSIISFEKILKKLGAYTKLALENANSKIEIFEPKAAYKFRNTAVNSYYLNYNALNADIKTFMKNLNGIVLCVSDQRRAESIAESLREEGIAAKFRHSCPDGFQGVAVCDVKITRGFNFSKSKVVLIGEDELIKKNGVRKSSSNKRKVFTMPKCGDFVVHEIHGIGRCRGIERQTTGKISKDYVVVEYQDNGILYVPVEQLDRLERYSGNENAPRLNKLGGAEFKRLKDKVKASVKEMAFDLMQLYSQREKAKGYKYPKDDELQTMFEAAFEYNDTPDQVEATREIKEDMERGVVMDRLLCGDVGYGKTEVALRAVFKTVTENKQAAILAPTTILARQHYNTAIARFNDFGIKTVLLSRFQSAAEIKVALKAIESGEANVVVATHRILSKDVHFKDLGLLVLDEEQRFGVEHKEKLKLLKNNVNVLTLSATPIPRTLNMALSGIRDISLLETPPENRLPVQTYVMELTDALLKDAIERELARGGQVFVLFNRVAGIESFAAHIAQLVPSGRVIYAHGQMEDVGLERAINDFYAKQADVLVCTTIIENGIDLPDANTLIVCDADKLGLSALYQLRGRVGRNNKLAYAYFTTKGRQEVSETAHKRLAAIMDYTELGSGFQIAMRDLEIRGAGNVLGRDQHGHMSKVGYDMYCRLLEEAVEELSGQEIVKKCETEVICDIDAYIPESMVKGVNDRLRLYKEIAAIKDLATEQKILTSIKDAYGKIPETTINLADISLIRNLASMLGAKKVVIDERGAGIIMESDDCLKNSNLMFAVSQMQEQCVLSAASPPTIVFKGKNLTIKAKIELVKSFLTKTSSNLQ